MYSLIKYWSKIVVKCLLNYWECFSTLYCGWWLVWTNIILQSFLPILNSLGTASPRIIHECFILNIQQPNRISSHDNFLLWHTLFSPLFSIIPVICRHDMENNGGYLWFVNKGIKKARRGNILLEFSGKHTLWIYS